MQIYTIFWSLTQKKVRLLRINGSGGKLKKKMWSHDSITYLWQMHLLSVKVAYQRLIVLAEWYSEEYCSRKLKC